MFFTGRVSRNMVVKSKLSRLGKHIIDKNCSRPGHFHGSDPVLTEVKKN